MARVSIFQSGDEATTSSGSIVTASFENEMTAAKQSQERWKFKKKWGGKKVPTHQSHLVFKIETTFSF